MKKICSKFCLKQNFRWLTNIITVIMINLKLSTKSESIKTVRKKMLTKVRKKNLVNVGKNFKDFVNIKCFYY